MIDKSVPSFARYLESKRTVDDRALNARVWDRLTIELDQIDHARPIRVLEVGAGVGTMVDRLRFASMLQDSAYTLLDSDEDLIDAARIRLSTLPDIDLTFVTADAFDYLDGRPERADWDLIIAHAVLDLSNVHESIPILLGALRPGGLLYASINYDGVTSFTPEAIPGVDAQVERLYNTAMRAPHADGTIPTGDRTGRALIPALRQSGAKVLEAGASDWVVFSDGHDYRADEAYFLRSILGFVEETLTGHQEIDPEELRRWLSIRHRQIATGDLVYIAHQIDVLAMKPH